MNLKQEIIPINVPDYVTGNLKDFKLCFGLPNRWKNTYFGNHPDGPICSISGPLSSKEDAPIVNQFRVQITSDGRIEITNLALNRTILGSIRPASEDKIVTILFGDASYD